MADDPIKSFMVQLGFKADEGAAKKVVDTAKKVEDGVTKAAEEGADKRTEAEQQASKERIGIIQALGKIFVAAEQDRADRATKIRKDEAAKDEKLQAEREKKAKERRAAALKEAQVQATRMAAFALKAVGAVEAAALGVVYATDRAAQAMERLNYLSQRSGTTSSNVTAFSYGISQVGGSVESGNAMVKALGSRLRDNPNGYAQILKSLGVQARDANGHMRDTVAIAGELGAALARKRKEGPYGNANANNYGRTFGWSDDDVQNATDPRLGKFIADRRAIDAKTGANQNDAAAAGTKFEQSMRRLEAVLDSVKTKVETGLFKLLQPQLDKLSEWGEQHGGQVADVIGRIANDLLHLATVVLDHLAKVDWDQILTGIENFGRDFDTKTKEIFGENGAVLATLTAFGVAVGLKVLGPLGSVLSTLKMIGALNPAVLGTMVVGAVLASGDPNKSVLAGGHPDVTPRDNDLGLPGVDPPGENKSAASGPGAWQRFKTLFGFADSDPDAKRVRDAIIATAEGVKKIADQGAGGGAPDGGGLGGGVVRGGGFGAGGASLRDRARGGRGFGGGGGGGPADPNLPAGNVPGASGYGLINEYWRGSLDEKFNGQTPSPRELFSHFKSLGASDAEALMLTGGAASESRFNPNARHDPDPRTGKYTGFGMWGHKLSRLNMEGKDWKQQAEAALAEERRMFGDRVSKAKTPEEIADWEMHYEGPKGYHKGTPRSGHNYMGRLNSIRRFMALAGQKGGPLPNHFTSTPQFFVGDSIAQGLQVAANGLGNTKVGANPEYILGQINQLDPEALKGKDIILSGGASNSPGSAGLLKRQIEALKAKGVDPSRIKVLGVGPRADFRGVNDLLGRIAKEQGATFLGGIHAGPDQVHPSDYKGMLDGIRGGKGVKVDVSDGSAAKVGRAVAHANNLHLQGAQAALRRHSGHLLAGLHPHAHLSAVARAAIDNSRRQVTMTHNPTFHINGGDPHSMLADAHRLAGRGHADMVRNMSVMEA